MKEVMDSVSAYTIFMPAAMGIGFILGLWLYPFLGIGGSGDILPGDHRHETD